MTFQIKQYHPDDHDSIYDICLKTGNSGKGAEHMHDDPMILGHIYAGPYINLEPESAFILHNEGHPCGYIIGAVDTQSFFNKVKSNWLMSSVDSALNSGATIWTKDVYQKFVKPDASPEHLLIVGRWITTAMLGIAIFFAQFATRFESIYDLSQTILSLFQGPSLAIIVLGMLWKRATGKTALISLISGVIFAGTLMWVNSNASVPLFQVSEPFLYVAWWSFVLSVVIVVVVSLMTPPEPESKLKGLVYRYE